MADGWCLITLVSLVLAYISDRYKLRGPVLFVTGIIATAGYALYLSR